MIFYSLLGKGGEGELPKKQEIYVEKQLSQKFQKIKCLSPLKSKRNKILKRQLYPK